MERKPVRAYISPLPEVYRAQVFTDKSRHMVAQTGNYYCVYSDRHMSVESETMAKGRFGYKPAPYLRVLLLYLGNHVGSLPHE